MMFFVYAIKSDMRNRIYIGHAKDIERRLRYHNFGYVRSTAKHRPWVLVAKQGFGNRNEARWLERQLKRSIGRRDKWLAEYRSKEE
jgi:predicted GIY-YIG superfamily endonuclease